MTQIVVSRELSEKLVQSDMAELVDDTGTVLGSFVSFLPHPIDPSLVPPISEEAHQRLMLSPGKHSTEEVLAYLRSL